MRRGGRRPPPPPFRRKNTTVSLNLNAAGQSHSGNLGQAVEVRRHGAPRVFLSVAEDGRNVELAKQTRTHRQHVPTFRDKARKHNSAQTAHGQHGNTCSAQSRTTHHPLQRRRVHVQRAQPLGLAVEGGQHSVAVGVAERATRASAAAAASPAPSRTAPAPHASPATTTASTTPARAIYAISGRSTSASTASTASTVSTSAAGSR